MYPAADDYNPIVQQGSIERASGILGRRKMRQSLPTVEHGQAIVFIGADGGVISGSGYTSAGERYWGSATRWIIPGLRRVPDLPGFVRSCGVMG
jgi:hypothetical protein